MGTKNIRPGFVLKGRYSAPSTIKRVFANEENDSFISFDQLGLHLWKLNTCSTAISLKRVPSPRPNFVTCMLYISGPRLVACACLDGNLRLYKYDLRLKSTLPWGETVVFDMHHIVSSNEIVVSGAQGIKIYYTEPDFEAYARSVKDPEDVVSAECNPWAFGQCQQVKARLCLHVPGLELQHPDSYRQGAQTLWLDDADAVVFTAVCGSVFAFSVLDGTCVATWERIHTQHISAFLYLPDRCQAVSVCESPKAIVWKVQSWKAKYVCTFGAFTSLVTALQRVPDSPSIVIATQDGSLKMWCMETLQPQVSIKAASGISHFRFASAKCGIMWHGVTAHVLLLHSIFPTFFTCTSMPILMERTCSGNILVRFEDDSARMLDSQTGKPVMSVPPQLASQSVSNCAWSAFSKTMYMLLSNSVVHVWQPVPQTDQTQLVAVWTEHRRSRLVTLCIAPQETIPQTQLHFWGLPPGNREDEFLFAGTADGDVWIMDRGNGAQMISFCAHKLCSVKHIVCDHRQQRMLTVAGSAARVWTFKNGVRSMGTTDLGTRGTSTAVCGKHFIIGTANGAIHLVESKTGLCAITLACAIHTSTVHSIHADQSREWLVSSSADGTVKVWTLSGAVISCLQNTRKVTCACFLNDTLDILLAAPTQLQVSFTHHVFRCQEGRTLRSCTAKRHSGLVAHEASIGVEIERLKQMTLSNPSDEAPVILRMTEKSAKEMPVLGSGPRLDVEGKGTPGRVTEQARWLSGDETETTNSEDESFRALLLQHAEHCCKPGQTHKQCCSTDPSVESALQPMQKKVLHVLQDPDMFWDGCVDLPS